MACLHYGMVYLRKCIPTFSRQTIRALSLHNKLLREKQVSNEEDCTNQPVKFSTSQAATWKAEYTRMGGPAPDRPWYQGVVISLSIGIFMIYFCILREENDIDAEMKKSIYERIPGLEEAQLKLVYDYNQQNGLDNTQIVQRMRELEKFQR